LWIKKGRRWERCSPGRLFFPEGHFVHVSEKQKSGKNRYPRKEHPVWILARSANMFYAFFVGLLR